MNNLEWCINYLKGINNIKANLDIDFYTFRALLNITMPINLSADYYIHQDEVLQNVLKEKEIIDVNSLDDGISIIKGDITLIKADAIVNACNNKMLGCFVPNHHCIDNAIHTFAGLQVRRDMMEIMEKLGHDEVNGNCKVTKAYNLPSKYILHTVGPIYNNTKQNEIDLRSCYLSCLEEADRMNLNSIVFCSLSTGVFGYPIEKASVIALNAIKDYLSNYNKNIKKVIIDLFNDNDYYVYKERFKEL